MLTRPLTVEALATLITESTGVPVDPVALASEPASRFEDLGVESLGMLGVVVKIENSYGVRLGTDAERCQTPDELVAMVNEQLNQVV
jgi:minimal PKS acyl carrier protein